METMLKISAIISIFGISLLLFLANVLEPKLTDISEINNKMLNRKVKISGEVFSVTTYEDSGFQVISIKDETGRVDVTTNEILNLKNTHTITVTGRVKEYKQYLKVEADKILQS